MPKVIIYKMVSDMSTISNFTSYYIVYIVITICQTLANREVEDNSECVTAERYGCKNGGCVVRLCSVARRGDARIIGVRLRAIDGSAGQAYESGCAAALGDAVGFCGFLFDLW